MAKNLLILTATIAPQTEKSIIRLDKNTRLNDYKIALEFYRKNLDSNFDILFVENSDSIHLIESDYKSIRKVKFIQAPLDNRSLVSGKSAGEIEMLKFLCLKNYLEKYDYIWKVTGRLVIKNINELVKENTSDIYVYRFREAHSCDSRFFGMRYELFCNFASKKISFEENADNMEKRLLNAFQSMEYYLAYFCVQMSEIGLRLSTPIHIPYYVGFGASTGKKLNTIKFRLFFFLTNKLRRFAIRVLGGYTA